MKVGFTPLLALVVACGPSTGTPEVSSSDSGSTFGLDTSSASAAEATSNATHDTSTISATSPSSSEVEEASTNSASASSSSTTDGTTASTDDSSSTGAPSESCDEALACADDCAQWESTLGGDPEVRNSFTRPAIAADGTILVAGQRDAIDEDPGHSFLRRYDADGALLDEQLLLEEFDDVNHFPANLAIAADGRIAVVGRLYVDEFDHHGFVDLRAADGTNLARDIVEEPSGILDVYALAFSSDGTLFVGGVRELPEGHTAILRAYDDALDLLWELTGAELGTSNSIAMLTPVGDGELFAITSDWIGRIASDGTPVWSAAMDELGGSPVSALAITATPSGDALVAGAWFSGGVLGAWAGRLDGTTGDVIWSVEYPEIVDEVTILTDIVADDDGRIFVSGYRHFTGTDVAGPNPSLVQQLDCAGGVVWEWSHVDDAGFDQDSGRASLAWSDTVGLAMVGAEQTGGSGTHVFLTRLVPSI